ncbi:MAG: 5'-methylthioadenosine/S-adenosylhomocysteine nucleosidase [Bacteroidales bacterium]|nr:5'-methylthioadenosine/S-adenosylhomocysteine nucleosidase [Bacteroidales bacterium]
MMKILFVYAIPEERIDINIPNAEVIYVETGMGKVNAAMKTMRAICEYHPDMVINFGTAGTLNHKVGDIFVCNHFIDRDLRKVTLDGVISEIEFEKIERFSNSVWGVCNTGDSFITSGADIEGDVIDMEAYAEAEVCREMGIPFISVKYVTDVVGQNSVESWLDKLADARKGLTEFFK